MRNLSNRLDRRYRTNNKATIKTGSGSVTLPKGSSSSSNSGNNINSPSGFTYEELSALAPDIRLRLSWFPALEDNITEYLVYISEAAITTSSSHVVVTNNFYETPTLKRNTTYYFGIAAKDSLGNVSAITTIWSSGSSATYVTGEGVDPVYGVSSADNISYDNTSSELVADNVQDAIDELDATIDGIDTGLVGTKEVDETNIADGRIQEYDSTSDKMIYVDKPTGTGDGRYYILITDEKAAGTDGGTFTSGAWQTRALNSEKSDAGNYASVSGNQITLAAGTYEAEISCPAKAVLAHQARLYNITDSATTLVGTTESTDTGGKENFSVVLAEAATTRSIIRGRFTIAAQKVFAVQHRCASTCASYGQGKAVNWDEVEVYTIAQFYKVS